MSAGQQAPSYAPSVAKPDETDNGPDIGGTANSLGLPDAPMLIVSDLLWALLELDISAGRETIGE